MRIITKKTIFPIDFYKPLCYNKLARKMSLGTEARFICLTYRSIFNDVQTQDNACV